jgi:hypothetical protein
MTKINDIGTARVNDHIDKFVKGYESLTLPQLVEHFNEAIEGDPDQREEATLILEGLRKFIDKQRKTASVGARCLAAAIFMQNMCTYAAICGAEAEEAETATT